MSKNFTFNNVLVSFSTMMNREDKAPYGRVFKVRIPLDDPELKRMEETYKVLNDKAKLYFGEKVGKKLKNADMQVFDESPYAEGFVELGFNIYFKRERDVKQEDGTTIKEKYEKLNPIYEGCENFCYKVNNNGEKEYETPNGKKWQPLSSNKINLEVSLVSKYDKKNNKPSISFKADSVEIIQSDFSAKKGNGPDTGFFSLDDIDDEVPQKENKPAPKEKDTGMFSESDLASLDV